MSEKKIIYFRTTYISTVILACIILGLTGIFEAYKSIRLIGFGEYRDAVKITKEKIVIFDYEKEIK